MYGSDRYKQSRLSTAQPGDLVVMLYDGIVRFLTAGVRACEENDPATTGIAITRALDIIAYLQAILRVDVAPELSDRLDAAYSAWSTNLVKANVDRDSELLANVLEQVQGLRDAWHEANEQVKSGEAGDTNQAA
jgi:flagellar protein FliS